MSLAIRRAEPSDAGTLSAIARAAKASWGYPAAALASWEAALRISPEYLARELVVCALSEDRIAGFYALERREDRWMLEHLWVEPAFQRRGIGRRLFAHALAQVVAPGIVTIEADPHAAAFYASMGAREVGSIPAPIDGDPDRRLPVLEIEVRRP
jgi:GNAT superfamily N-acetyltransferase